MFSQWATKRVCKFFMKRLLGRMLRSELDLEQLEVQLGFGTIQLKDIFLNTDYLNDQLGDASVAIKEGSIGSVRAKIPWKVLTTESCEIEVDELKLVIVPRPQCEENGSNNPAPSEIDDLRFVDGPQYPLGDADASGLGPVGGGAYMGVDDGVRMIAKMVERVLLGLRVKVSNMIIVFEEQPGKESDPLPGDLDARMPAQQLTPPHCLLIVRVAYVEYGVEAPQIDSEEPVKAASGTEQGMLVKVVKFKGATVEVVDVQDEIVGCEGPAHDPEGIDGTRTDFLGQPVFVLFGEGGGLEGSIQLSVPWRDGIVDVPKVHADISISPLKLRLSPHQIEQVLSFAQAYSREGGLGAGSSPSGPALKSSMWNGDFTGSRFYSALDRNSELFKSFSGSMPGKSGRGIEAESLSTSFLPVTRFISDWMHWAGSEGQRKDGTVAEADLAASVDEFFECFDGTRSSQASSSSSGMWYWTRSAFSAITAASSLAAGSIVLTPDPPKQPEYSMKARLSGISVDLYYDCMSVRDNYLTPTLASELRPLKDISPTLGSREQTSPDADRLDGPAEECLIAELRELNISLMVSGPQTEFCATVKDLDVSEVVLKELSDEMQIFGRASRKSQLDNSVPVTRILQASIEQVLPSFPISFSTNQLRFGSPKSTPGRKVVEQEGLIGSHHIAQTMARKTMYEKKQLLRVLSEPDYAARVTVTWHCPPPGSGATPAQTEITGSLQPLAIWLDVHTVKRIESMMQKSTVRSRSAKGTGSNQSSRLPQEVNRSEKRTGLPIHDHGAEAVSESVNERGPFRVKLLAPCFRVIICFPVGFGPGSSLLQEDFAALDIDGPSAQSGLIQPLVDFTYARKTKTVSSSSAADTLMVRFGDITATLVSTMDEMERGSHGDNGFAFTANELLFISQQDIISESLPTLDRQLERGVSLEFQWQGGSEVGSWIAKRVWDGVAAQQSQGDGGRGIGGSNSEFAAATTAAEAVEDENSQIRKELLACSSSSIRVNIPHIKLRLSEPQYTRVLELVGCFIDALVLNADEGSAERNTDGPVSLLPEVAPSDTSGPPSKTLQTSILVQCGRVDVTLCLRGQQVPPGVVKQDPRLWDVIRLNFDKLQVLSVLGVGGHADCSYLWVHHEDCEVTGSFFDESLSDLSEGPEMLLLSCKRESLGRGDGGIGNALAAGKAGLTITHMVWPGQGMLGDALLTGAIRGITFVAHSGRLDWLSAIIQFFNPSDQLEASVEMSLRSGLDDANEIDSKLDQTASPSMRTFFLLDFHDVALCYEPGSEVMPPGGIRSGRDSWGRGVPSSAESSQILAPVASVVAAAAVRVSSSVVPRVTGEQYDIWLRDVALHLLDTMLRKETSFGYTTESMHRTGYVQIAREAVMEALVRIDGENGLQWELECANNQLRFDTCHDTTAAFGRLVAQLQQLFVPEIEPQSANLKPWTGDGSGAESPSFKNMTMGAAGDVQIGADSEEFNSNKLFEGVLEDAFSRARSSRSSAVGDDVVDDLQAETYSVVGGTLHSRVSSMDRHEFLDRSRQDVSVPVITSVSSTPTRLPRAISRTSSEESVLINNTGLPTFIEDYYVTTQNHSLQSVGVSLSRQTGDSPRLSAGSSRQPSRESTSSGAGREAEGKGVWYTGKCLEVMEDHVPDEVARVDGEQGSQRSGNTQQGHSRKLSLPKKYPSSVGRVILRDLRARWSLYGGSDWPTSKAGQHQRSPCQSNLEESGRQTGTCLEVLLDGMDLQYDSFPAVGLYASRLVVSIRDIGVYDCSSDAPWKMVLGYHRSKSRPRESSSQAVKIEMDSVRPNPSAPLEEYRLSIGLLPIRLHLDQRHIDFCIEFFSPRQSSSAPGQSSDEGGYSLAGSPISGSPELPPDTNGLVEDALLPFFQICELRPFTVRVDYLPRRVDLISLRGGNYAELLNLVTWKGIELNLKHVRAAGVHGWSSLSGVIFGEWLEDISQNQVHKFVRGVGPIRPLYAMGSGAAKLLVLPAEHYKKDRRLFRGMRKGAIAFLRSISLEALGLGAHLAAGAHEILQQTELALGGTPVPTSFTSEKGDRRSRAVQPGDAREGIQQACESLSQGLERTASSLVGNPLKVYQRGAGAGFAVASALRAAPAAAVAPASAAVGAFHRALLGVRNELDPEKKRESDEKHTGPPPDTRRAR
ncbi:unnamed protein product [Calypogeia fissa]